MNISQMKEIKNCRENLSANANYIKVERIINKFIEEASFTSTEAKSELMAMFFNKKNLLCLCDFEDNTETEFYNVKETGYMFYAIKNYDVPIVFCDEFIYNNRSPFLEMVKMAYTKIYDLRYKDFYLHTHRKLNSVSQKLFDSFVEKYSTYTKKEILEIIEEYYFDIKYKEVEEWQLENNGKEAKEDFIIKHSKIKHKYFKNKR